MTAPRLPNDCRLIAFEEIGSTNDHAKDLARAGAAHGTVVWARRQTAGRGRRANTWASLPGNLLTSVILRPACPAQDAGQLSFLCAVALRDLARACVRADTPVQLKWPNDLMIEGKKSAVARVRSGDWLDYGFGMGQPDAFDHALAARRDELRQVSIRSALTMRRRAVLEADRSGDHFAWLNWHFSGYDRRRHDEGLAHYVPMNFGEAPDYYRRFLDPVDMAVVKCCPLDSRGVFNFSGACTYHAALLERAKCVVVETDPAMP